MTQHSRLLISLDGGQTYFEPKEGVRIIFKEVDENDYETKDAHINMTSEGFTIAVAGTDSHDVEEIASVTANDIPKLTF